MCHHCWHQEQPPGSNGVQVHHPTHFLLQHSQLPLWCTPCILKASLGTSCIPQAAGGSLQTKPCLKKGSFPERQSPQNSTGNEPCAALLGDAGCSPPHSILPSVLLLLELEGAPPSPFSIPQVVPSASPCCLAQGCQPHLLPRELIYSQVELILR